MPDLVALDLPAGTAFVEALRAVWDAGDAIVPLDPRLPRVAVAEILDAVRPGAVIGSDGERTRIDGGVPVAEGDALVVATSGSTGAPKGVVLTLDAVMTSAQATSARLEVDPDHDTWLACLPLAHIGGLSVVIRALLTETPLVVHPRFDPEDVTSAMHDGATLVSLVATALGRIDATGFRKILLGGAAPPEHVDPNVVVTYGMTETGSGIVYDGAPLDGVEIAIGDGTLGAEGEVLVRGPMLLRAYRDGTDPRLADPRGGSGWLATGDGGWLDGDGLLHVTGRLAEVIVTGGEKVWPIPVEAVLRRHPGVADVAVVGAPDPEWGQRVVAHIVATDPAHPPMLAELRQAVADAMGPWAAPKELVLETVLPTTATGKIRRHELDSTPRRSP